MEVNDDNNLFRSARLEEAVLDVGEAHIYFLTLLGDKTNTVLLDLKVANGLFTSQVRSDDQSFQGFFALRTGSHDELFQFSFGVK